jgi:FkbM family methyltransferase
MMPGGICFAEIHAKGMPMSLLSRSFQWLTRAGDTSAAPAVPVESVAEPSPASRGEIIQATIRHAVTNMDGQGFVRVALNDRDLWLPPATIRTMTHCFHMEESGRFIILIERAQLDWLAAHLRAGSHFIDVGAATGAVALPLAKQFGQSIHITAFEPAAATRALLAATIQRNDLGWIKILPYACSERAGQADFYEFPQDEGDTTPFLPEASTLAATSDPRARRVPVELTTLDDQFAADRSITHAAIKIDVEGFEAKVLMGAPEFLARVRPSLAIDIHVNPFGEGTTENDVRRLLEPLGYRFDKLGHVLACEFAG